MKIQYIILLLFTHFLAAQENNTNEFTYNEFLGYVKKYHPLVKQANLKLNEAQAILMQARGAFDPKIEVDFSEKKFKNSNYYSLLNSSFKIPTWYGVELKASFDNSEGIYFNPENTTPSTGLTSVGISVPIGQGLWINQRMADLQKAKIQQNINEAERNLMAVEVLHNASLAYFNWKRTFQEKKLYEEYLTNATIRFQGIQKLIEQGDKPAIDSTEASITIKTRKLNLENATLKLQKAQLELSNFLWLEDNIPFELSENLFPEIDLKNTVSFTLKINNLDEIRIENNPKIEALTNKIEVLKIEQKLKANALLPKIDLSYNYLSEPDTFNNYRLEDYKIGVNFSFPIFLRNERASLKLSKLKVQDSEFGLQFEKTNLKNKIESQQFAINSLSKQISINEQLVTDFSTILSAEERLFSLGESSVFLINSRENSLVSSQLNSLQLENEYFNASIDLFRTLANVE